MVREGLALYMLTRHSLTQWSKERVRALVVGAPVRLVRAFRLAEVPPDNKRLYLDLR